MNMKAIIIGVICFLLFVVAWIAYGDILGVYLMISTAAGWMSPLGLGKYTSLLVAIPLAVFVIYASGALLSFSKTKRRLGQAMLFVLAMGVIGTLAYGTKDDRFDQHAGTARMRYVMDGSGNIKLYPENVMFDPKTGERTEMLTSLVAQQYEARKKETQFQGLNGLKEVYKPGP